MDLMHSRTRLSESGASLSIVTSFLRWEALMRLASPCERILRTASITWASHISQAMLRTSIRVRIMLVFQKT